MFLMRHFEKMKTDLNSLKGKAMHSCRTALALILHLLATLFLCIIVYLLHKCPHGNFSRAAVAADSETCSVIGRDILQQGGSAVDAAIAALLCTSVINPQSAGIGGGSIFTVMDSSGKVKIINSRETVPSAAPYDLLQLLSEPCEEARGSQYIGVPGEIRSYDKAHQLYGKLPWADLFKPTIKLAREGIRIPDVQGSCIPTIKNTDVSRALRKLFSDDKGNLLRIGDFVKFEKLADTLEIIANNGADSFYTGKIAEDLVRDVQEAGGILTLQDLKMYKVNMADAVTVPFGEYQMYTAPPPATGGVLLSLLLNIMQEYRYKPEPQSDDEKAEFFHIYAEALKFANRLKLHIRDPHILPQNIEKILTDERFANQIRAMIKPGITLESHEYNIPLNLTSSSSTDGRSRRSSSFGGTSHVSVLAEDGSAVSATSSINRIFGSQIYSPRTGVILNNQLADFCGKVNDILPGERPPSSMAPSILKSESSLLVIGASGASFITTGIASALINHLWFKKGLKEAIDTPVLAVDIRDLVKFEPIWEKNINQFLIGWRHNVSKFQNVVNAVEKKGGCICAVSDYRKRGKAAGY